jgi:predicted kinase
MRETKPVLIVTGPPGVGKTTAADILVARSSRAVHLESDSFFRFIRSGYLEPWRRESHAQNRIVMEIVAQAAAAYAAAGYFTVLDGIVIPGWFLEPLREALIDAGQPVAFAVLRAPLSACRARAESRARAPLDDPAALEQLWRSFADLGQLEPHAIEVGDLSPADVADLLERRLQEGRLAI